MNTQLNQFNVLLKRSGKTCTLNNTTTNVIGIFKEIDNKDNSIDTKYFYSEAPLQQGDIITYDNFNYIIITKNHSINNAYTIYTVREMPFTVKFAFNSTVKVFPFYADAKVFDISNNKYFNTASGQMNITMQSNNDTSQIAIQQRFIKFGSAWEVTGKNCTQEGLLCLSCTIDTFNSNDDKTNEIAGNTNNYVLAVSPTTVSVDVGKTQQITASVENNGTIVTSPTFTYVSSDTSIATISNTGLVTAVKAGSCNITVNYITADNQTLTKTIVATITAVTPVVPDLVINGSTTLTIGSQNTYTLKNKDGTAITTGAYTWSITYNPANATIVSQANTTCVLKGVKYGVITLSVTDNMNTYTKNINVQNGGW